ncbi:uncharacterized protein YdcI [Euwallacea similis]|uniref:uncharacterized protein YdcI n=1 Tax=Euwallacea similis TaxID=1736056 RepID=UPI00345067F5
MVHDSSDEDEAPIQRKSSRINANRKSLPEPDLLTSDSEVDTLVFKKLKQPKAKKLLGEISLITSDEDSELEALRPERNIIKKTSKPKKRNKIKTIVILTSDEDEDLDSTSKILQKKRKHSEDPIDLEVTSRKKTVSGRSQTEPKKIKKARTISPIRTINLSHSSLNSSTEEVIPLWKDSELLAEKSLIDEQTAQNLIKLWEQGNTIPFIARYRKNVIGDMTPDVLRTTKEDYDEICNLKKRMVVVAKTVAAQQGKLDDKLQSNICAARTLEELEYIYAPFKPESKGSLADRARKCGLEEPALHILNNTALINLAEYVDTNVKQVNTIDDVEKGIVHIVATEIATHIDLIAFLRELRAKSTFRLQTKKCRQVKEKSLKTLKKKEHMKKDSSLEEAKFELYFDFNQAVDYLKSHQILAINRGESLKILSVKIEIPEFFEMQFRSFCTKKWVNVTTCDGQRQVIIKKAIEDAFQRLITPHITREIRADLKLKAEKESCKIFSDNLKHLLLSPPMKGKSILGIDPGYTNGCKLALISPTGSLMAQNVVYPHNKRNEYRGEKVIKDLLAEYNCNLIAIGNGTACRQTEEWISSLIREDFFFPVDVQYTIVSEDGASIYSCSPEAKKEFGNLDPNIISAVSLARRIQDPMAELVKVEPSHLGVGMYQLDIKKKQLEEALSEVVSECVSFVGVDLNTASQCLLRRVAGLSDKRSTQIIEYRDRNGPFTHRKELLKVFGIGERIFEQCAGFLRVAPMDPNYYEDFYSKSNTTPLDATIIHPESYPVVRRILKKLNLKEKEIGTEKFIITFKSKVTMYDFDDLAETLKTNKQTIQLIFDALGKMLNHDLRSEISRTPLFKKDVISIQDLVVGTILTGRVKNVTSFGAFVDIGVGRDGLVHSKFMKGLAVHLGNVLEVKVIDVDVRKGRIHLEILKKIS